MNPQLMALIALLSPVIFVATAIASWYQPGMRPALVKKMGIVSTLIGILIATICSVLVINNTLLETSLLGIHDIGFSLRLDSLSMLMFAMISLLSFIVMRFSMNYLDGDARQGIFIGRLSATIACVQLLVLSGNLGLVFAAWVLTSISLHRLLVFYNTRPGAIVAARKKFIFSRLGDACLLAALVMLYFQFDTGNLELIFQGIKNSIASGETIVGIEIVAVLITLAALLKSAQFPTHGWLLEVMETPTPVSALLHAGLLNAGPFLIVRMAYVMEASTYASVTLIVVGGFTALFASVVFLTQTSIKTALAYSSIAHMGFSFLLCGLGLYPAAILHLVAHSFYKAHAFLSSGSVIDVIRSTKITSAKRLGKPIRIGLGILLGLLVYTGFAMIWGMDLKKDLALLAVGGIIMMGLSRIYVSALDSNGSIQLMLRACLMSITVAGAFFTLESGMHHMLISELPEVAGQSFLEIILMTAILLTFGTVVFIQMVAPIISAKPAYQTMAIHLRNGLYVNTLLDRMVRALYSHGNESKTEVVESVAEMKQQKLINTGVIPAKKAFQYN